MIDPAVFPLIAGVIGIPSLVTHAEALEDKPPHPNTDLREVYRVHDVDPHEVARLRRIRGL